MEASIGPPFSSQPLAIDSLRQRKVGRGLDLSYYDHVSEECIERSEILVLVLVGLHQEFPDDAS